jgi:hypothetical protein
MQREVAWGIDGLCRVAVLIIDPRLGLNDRSGSATPGARAPTLRLDLVH